MIVLFTSPQLVVCPFSWGSLREYFGFPARIIQRLVSPRAVARWARFMPFCYGLFFNLVLLSLWGDWRPGTKSAFFLLLAVCLACFGVRFGGSFCGLAFLSRLILRVPYFCVSRILSAVPSICFLESLFSAIFPSLYSGAAHNMHPLVGNYLYLAFFPAGLLSSCI